VNPSSKVNYMRLQEVKRTSLLILIGILLFTYVVTHNMLNFTFEILFAVIVGALAGSWSFFLGTGKVWQEWFWKKRLK